MTQEEMSRAAPSPKVLTAGIARPITTALLAVAYQPRAACDFFDFAVVW